MPYNRNNLPAPYTKAGAEFSKLVYKTNKAYVKMGHTKTKEKEAVSKYSTFYEAVESNISSFNAEKKKLAKGVGRGDKNATSTYKEIEEKEIQYLLDLVPFVSEYNKNEVVVTEEAPKKSDISSMFQVTSKNTNNNTFLKYLYHVEQIRNGDTVEAVTEKESTDSIYTCKCGGRMEKHISSTENHLVCVECGSTEDIVESYTVCEQHEGAVYKRTNHLAECLNALQGKEGTNVPQHVIEAIKTEFKKNRISTTDEIKPDKVKQYLKKLGFSKYYENIHTIAYSISGIPTLKLSKELEKKFKDMFVEIQEPFYRHKNPKRKNFLSYNYVLYKFAELLGEDDLLKYFPLLKCSKNLHAHDTIWKKICEDLKWEYIATV